MSKHLPFYLVVVVASACSDLPHSLGYGVDDLLGGGSGNNGVAGSGTAGSGDGVAGSGAAGTGAAGTGTVGDPATGCDDGVAGSYGVAGSGYGAAGSGYGAAAPCGVAGTGGSGAGGTATTDDPCIVRYDACLLSDEDPRICRADFIACEDSLGGVAGSSSTGGGVAGTGGTSTGVAGSGSGGANP